MNGQLCTVNDAFFEWVLLHHQIKRRITHTNYVRLNTVLSYEVATTPKVYSCSKVGDSLPPAGSKVIPKA